MQGPQLFIQRGNIIHRLSTESEASALCCLKQITKVVRAEGSLGLTLNFISEGDLTALRCIDVETTEDTITSCSHFFFLSFKVSPFEVEQQRGESVSLQQTPAESLMWSKIYINVIGNNRGNCQQSHL